jgi:hypothetical protein
VIVKKKKDKFKKKKGFKLGDVVAFDYNNFNPEYWDNLPEADRIKYYGPLGYGAKSLKTFVFVTEMKPQDGHCVLIDMDDGHIEIMRHTSDFRKCKDEEL